MSGSLSSNIAGTLYFLSFQLAGIILISILLKKEGSLTKLLIGSAAGSLLLHWVPVLFSFFLNFTMASHIAAMLCLVPVYIFAFLHKTALAESYTDLFKQMCRHRFFLIALAAVFVLWSYLLYTHTIPLGKDGTLYTGQCTYGDMNMHLGFITSIAEQGTFPPRYSLFPGTKLSYPFLSDSISSGIYLMGASLRYAYILPILTAFLQIAGSVYLFAMTLFHCRAKALLTSLFYFFNGGLGFLYFLGTGENSTLTWKDIFTGFYTTPTNLTEHNIRWVNMIADMLLPQRATLFGYALLFPCIWLLYQAAFRNKKEYFPAAGIFASALPMIHTHSFLGMGLTSASFLLLFLYHKVMPERKYIRMGGFFFSLFLLCMCFLQFFTKKGVLTSENLLFIGIFGITLCLLFGIFLLGRYLRENGWRYLLQTWGIYLLFVLLFAFPQLFFWTFDQVAAGGFLQGHFNWGNQGEFYPLFYLKNIGMPLLLMIAAICKGRKNSSFLFFPAFLLWLIAELIVFTPNPYDNNKLLYIAYLFLCLAAADYGTELYKRMQHIPGRKLLAVCFLFLSVISAVLTLGREVVSKYPLYSPSQTALAEYIEENTAADAIFLTNTRHNNEIASLTGRNIVCGSDTFLYFHGIDTSKRKEHLRLMYEAPGENQDLFAYYQVSYVVISPWEWADYAIDEAYFAVHFEPVYTCDAVILYKIK